MLNGYQSPVYGTCVGTAGRGYLLIPLDGGQAYFHPHNGAAPIKCPMDNPPKWAVDNPFYPFYPDND